MSAVEIRDAALVAFNSADGLLVHAKEALAQDPANESALNTQELCTRTRDRAAMVLEAAETALATFDASQVSVERARAMKERDGFLKLASLAHALTVISPLVDELVALEARGAQIVAKILKAVDDGHKAGERAHPGKGQSGDMSFETAVEICKERMRRDRSCQRRANDPNISKWLDSKQWREHELHTSAELRGHHVAVLVLGTGTGSPKNAA